MSFWETNFLCANSRFCFAGKEVAHILVNRGSILLNTACKSIKTEGRGKAHPQSCSCEMVAPLSIAKIYTLASACCLPKAGLSHKMEEKRVGYVGAGHTSGCTLLHRGEQPENCICGENAPSLTQLHGLSHFPRSRSVLLSHKEKTHLLWADSVFFLSSSWVVPLSLHSCAVTPTPSAPSSLHFIWNSSGSRAWAGVTVAPGWDRSFAGLFSRSQETFESGICNCESYNGGSQLCKRVYTLLEHNIL